MTWRRAGVVALALVLASGLLVGAQALRMHRDSGEWRLTRSPTPHRIHVGQRDYDRGDLARVALPTDAVVQGETPGGGTVYAPEPALGPGGEVLVPLVVHVADGGTDEVLAYELVGGP